MKFEQYIDASRIIDIRSTSFDGALRELVLACNLESSISIERAVSAIMEHERTVTTCIGNGVAVPHTRLNVNIPLTLAFGRCKNGLSLNASDEYKNVRYVMLMLSSNNEKAYLNTLTDIVHTLQNSAIVESFNRAYSLDTFKERVLSIFAFQKRRAQEEEENSNGFFLEETSKRARAAMCSTVLIFGGSKLEGVDFQGIFDDLKIVIAAPKHAEFDTFSANIHFIAPLLAPNSIHWLYEFRSAVLLGLSRDIIKYDEKVCCLGSNSHDGTLDTLFIIDVRQEFCTIFSSETQFLTKNIKPEVLERVLSIASEISMEGREGRPVGCLFVIGDVEKIKEFSKPLVLNPFFGYGENERNILSPFMDETVKEFSTIDGAFIIRGDGIIESAGTLINTPEHNVVMPSGFGTRHTAAASISWAAECIAIVVSESTHRVTLFQNGQMLPVVKKG
ncbi:MAG: diadenylate cyclase [Puniceicoccales bacterium]|jgi:DNA integrity scanning protein DisA with diadenylate cyclase activity/mannitol/fructose-specific phosphotransferase system IIA component (Ntr-type)|nr:diadenylate cyclase [Puniceicoccales bacterium]